MLVLEEIHLIFARNLKAIREREKLSLEKVSQLCGVSKTMIGQIERGESSPTLTTIWKIATGLKVSFTALIHQPQSETEVVLKKDIQVLSEDNGKYRVYPNFPFQEDSRFEIYTIEIDQGGQLSAEGHKEGTEEFITVFAGELMIRVNDHNYTLKSGDSIRFKADRPHDYRNAGDTLTKLGMTIYYPHER
ncbi:helix-turn-helix domain-containing protein [Lysinibacillus sphaericus]|uniref:helix-turn-helix domain-containing protein n=1 Tax=Lysinibacillus TaxID=400634 RepID=UPI00358DCACE